MKTLCTFAIKPFTSLKLSLSLVALLLAAPCFASPADDAEQTVRTTFDTVAKIVADNQGKVSEKIIDQKLQDVLLPVFDFEEMSRGSLGASWKSLSEPQRKEFMDLFASLLSRTYLHRIRTKIKGSEITFLQPMINNNRVVVRAKILSEGETISADYRMYQKDNKWRIYDAIVENVGLVTNYRNEFSNLMKDKGFDGLIQKLREQTQKLDTRDAEEAALEKAALEKEAAK